MYRIALINMPFASLSRPSIALMQLKASAENRYGSQIQLNLLYFNQEFGKELSVPIYSEIAETLWGTSNGFGDWFFRELAFPEALDNQEPYWQRFFPSPRNASDELKKFLLGKRAVLSSYLDRLIEEFHLLTYDLVGFTSMFSQNLAAFALARKLKSGNPNVTTIMGGANCESPMGQEIAKHVASIDFVFSGPALRSFPEFVGQRLKGQGGKCEEIKGVLCRSNLATVKSPSHAIGEDADINETMSLSYADFIQTIRDNFRNNEVQPTLMFETSRGCWWGQLAHCTFCGLNGSTMAYRALSPAKAIGLMNNLFQYAGNCSRFEAVDNIMPKEYLSTVFPHLQPPSNVSIFYEVKADLTRAELALLSKARVDAVQPGIESLATSVLKLMKKGTTASQNLRFLKDCLSTRIRPAWNLLIGFPGESESVYLKYAVEIPRLTHLPPPSGIFPIRFDRFSPYFTRAQEYGLELVPSEFYSYIYPFDKEGLRNIAYYFSDTNYLAPYIGFMSEWKAKLDPLVEAWRDRWRVSAISELPRLEMKVVDGACFIYDSRGIEPALYEITSEDERLLRGFETPRRLKDLEHKADAMAGMKNRVDELFRKGLLWEEDGRFISLVIIDSENGDLSDQSVAARQSIFPILQS